MSRQNTSGVARTRYKNPAPTTGGKCLRSKYERHQGPREMARRVRQMAAGKLGPMKQERAL